MDPSAALAELFGFSAFRPGQEAAVRAALADRDALVVMPTGAGKSLCYALPALLRDDLTVVVSPLVSLMQDQAQALERVAPGRVGLVNAQRQGTQNVETVRAAVDGRLRVLYVAPERFSVPRFRAAISQARIGLFVVDEAHCVSQWGHDFRPDYFALADAARQVHARATIALTATATPTVADDIAQRLELRDPARITTGFDRPNLFFGVIPCAGDNDCAQRIATALAEPDARPAIVYAGTRADTERLARGLTRTLGLEVLGYHAGLPRAERAQVQDRFMSGEVPIIVATNAFGMGIDKADVRTVCHAAVPGSLEAYYQEAGRAGRDGRPARCLLFAQPRHKALHVFFIQRARVSDAAFVQVAERLRWAGLDGRYDLKLAELGALTDAREPDEAARAIIGHLGRAGILAPEPSRPDRAVGHIAPSWGASELRRCRESAREAERARWAQYRAMWAYVEGGGCRRRTVLAHFGDRSTPQPDGDCCDVCHPLVEPAAAPPAGVDDEILGVVGAARPAVGRTRTVEILRGGRSQVVVDHGYDRLPAYGRLASLRTEALLARVDQLIAAGRLASTGGRFPKLRVGPIAAHEQP